MLRTLLLGALVAQAALGAPTDCTEFCDEPINSFGQSKSSYSSYAKSSYDHRMQRLSSGGSGLGLKGGRLENFDENVVGTIGTGDLNRPGNWRDEKHYVTDDGKGQMHFAAGQTVTNNGYSKFAQHSYQYGTHDSHAPQANSQILSTAEFNRALQNMQSRISSFMGNFHIEAGSTMNANNLQDFKNKASIISNQLNSVCNQVDVGSSMYQQMQQMIQQFQRDVEQRQREIEAVIFQSSSKSHTETHGSIHRYPAPSVNQPYQQTPHYAPVEQYTVRPTISPDAIKQQQLEEQIMKVQTLISTFYSSFNRPDTNQQYQHNLNAEVQTITQQIDALNLESIHNESMRARINHLRTQFDEYVKQLRSHIDIIVKRAQEEEAKRLEKLLKQKQESEAKMRQLAVEMQKLEEETARLRAQEAENQRLQMIQQQEAEKLQQALLLQKQQQQQQQQLLAQQQQQQQQILSHQQQQQQQILSQQQQVQPHITGTVEVSGSSSYQHNIKGSYQSQTHDSTTGTSNSYTQNSQGSHRRPQQIIQPHVDLTAAMSRLQQDLNRLQNEVNNFNMYTMRLTSANSATLVTEAERDAESLRQSINNLCESSSKYHNQDIQTSAEDLRQRFEELFRSFQRQAANYSSQAGSSSGFSASGGYSSQSSYGASGSYNTVKAPTVTNIEYQHSKSTEIEIGKRPASAASQHYSSGSGYSSSNTYGSQVDDQFKHGLIDLGQGSSSGQQVECVEMYAGQPCVDRPRRYRRSVEEYGPFYSIDHEATDNSQRHQPIFDSYPQYNENQEFNLQSPLREGHRQPVVGSQIVPLSLNPYRQTYGDRYDFSERTRPDFSQAHQPIRNVGFHQSVRGSSLPQGRHLYGTGRVEDLTRQPGESDDYYQQSRAQVRPATSEDFQWEQKSEDLSQQHVNLGQNVDLESLDKPRSQTADLTQRSRGQLQSPSSSNLETEVNTGRARDYGEFDRRPILNASDNSQHRISSIYENVGHEGDRTRLVGDWRYATSTERPQNHRPITTFRRPNQEPHSDEFTLQKSGFYNGGENQASTNKPLNMGSFEHSEYESRQSGRISKTENIAKHSETDQEVLPVIPLGSGDHTLQNSGFNDSPLRNGKIEFSENSQPVQSKPSIKFEHGQGSSTLDKSGFDDFPIRNLTPELSNKPKQEHLPVEGATHYQRGFESSFSNNGKMDKPIQFDSSDLTQQTNEQISFGPESQLGRQSSPHIYKPDRFGSSYNIPQQNPIEPPLTLANQEYNYQNKYSMGESNQQLQSGSSQTKESITTDHEGLLPNLHPTFKPAPKPIPRYTRPWQISRNVPQQQKSDELIDNQNTSIEHSTTSQNLNHDKQSQNLRGDVPGYSEPSTEPSIIEQKQTTANPDQPSNFNSGQQHIQVNFHANNTEYDSQQIQNEWQQNKSANNQFSHSVSQTYPTMQQNIHNNFEYSQQSNYYRQHNTQFQETQQIQKPIDEQAYGNLQFNQQSTPIKLTHGEEHRYQFHEQQGHNLETQVTSFEPHSGQLDLGQHETHFSLQHETSHKLEENFAEGIIPLEEGRPINGWSETDSSTTPQSFWKRVGHKLSNSYDKVKERARTIFG